MAPLLVLHCLLCCTAFQIGDNTLGALSKKTTDFLGIFPKGEHLKHPKITPKNPSFFGECPLYQSWMIQRCHIGWLKPAWHDDTKKYAYNAHQLWMIQLCHIGRMELSMSEKTSFDTKQLNRIGDKTYQSYSCAISDGWNHRCSWHHHTTKLMVTHISYVWYSGAVYIWQMLNISNGWNGGFSKKTSQKGKANFWPGWAPCSWLAWVSTHKWVRI